MTEAVAEATAAPSSSRGGPRLLRALAALVGWACALLAAAGLAAHQLDTRHQSLIVLAAAAWTLAPLSLVALVLHLVRRGWVSVLLTAALVVGQGYVYGPLFVAQTAPASPATTVRVLTQNMLYGRADAADLVARVRAARVDVFVAQELTAPAVARLRAAGLDRLLPHSTLDPQSDTGGTGLWSRFPLRDPTTLRKLGLAGVSAQLTLPGGVSLAVLTLHPSAPFPQDPAEWYSGLERIRGLLTGLPAGPAIVGGDLNATTDHSRFRRLLVDGWHDAAEQAGAGLVRSWPADQRPFPPVVGIDHWLTRGPVATSVRAVTTPGTDHMGLLATVVVPR